MEQNQLTTQELRTIFNTCSDEGKKILEEKFGKDAFTTMLDSFEDCCAYNGVTPEEVIPWKEPKNGDQRSVNAYAMLIQIIRANLRGKKKDWKNPNQRKYLNYYWMDGRSGSGLSLCDVDFDYSFECAGVASRLHSLDEETSRKIFEKYPQIVEDFMVEKD